MSIQPTGGAQPIQQGTSAAAAKYLGRESFLKDEGSPLLKFAKNAMDSIGHGISDTSFALGGAAAFFATLVGLAALVAKFVATVAVAAAIGTVAGYVALAAVGLIAIGLAVLAIRHLAQKAGVSETGAQGEGERAGELFKNGFCFTGLIMTALLEYS